jgi:hypothetical protein
VERLTSTRHSAHLFREPISRISVKFFGGPSRNRTGVQGFAVLCVTTPPSGLTVVVEARSSGLAFYWQFPISLIVARGTQATEKVAVCHLKTGFRLNPAWRFGQRWLEPKMKGCIVIAIQLCHRGAKSYYGLRKASDGSSRFQQYAARDGG